MAEEEEEEAAFEYSSIWGSHRSVRLSEIAEVRWECREGGREGGFFEKPAKGGGGGGGGGGGS